MTSTETIDIANLVKHRLSYDPATGEFTWKDGICAGKIAGTQSSRGYVSIHIGGRGRKAHRLAWLVTYGEMPAGDVDHINGCRSDNRIANLRACTRLENAQNIGRKGNIWGHPGLSRRPSGRFKVDITFRGHRRYLGTFDTVEEAAAAYAEAKARLHSFHPAVPNRACLGIDVRAPLRREARNV